MWEKMHTHNTHTKVNCENACKCAHMNSGAQKCVCDEKYTFLYMQKFWEGQKGSKLSVELGGGKNAHGSLRNIIKMELQFSLKVTIGGGWWLHWVLEPQSWANRIPAIVYNSVQNLGLLCEFHGKAWHGREIKVPHSGVWGWSPWLCFKAIGIVGGHNLFCGMVKLKEMFYMVIPRVFIYK